MHTLTGENGKVGGGTVQISGLTVNLAAKDSSKKKKLNLDDMDIDDEDNTVLSFHVIFEFN
jgi:hypothetical protein